ncbi:MAG: hypothetical protein ACTHOH_14150 [Lysobacteraceae bacterium]
MNVDATATDTATQDLDHLRLLAIFHYVVAAITGVVSLLPVIHLVIGIAMITGRMETADQEARFAGWFFVAFASVFIACGMTLAGFIAYAGRCLQRRRRHMLCLVVAALACMMMPFGTVLGVFTLITITKPQVKALFADTPER